jgi:hypothetical protein
MTPPIRRLVLTLAAIVVGALAFRTRREVPPHPSGAVTRRIINTEPAAPPSCQTHAIERLQEKLVGLQRVTASLRLGLNGNSLPLRGREIATLLRIIDKLTVFEAPDGVECIQFPSFVDEVTIRTGESSSPMQIYVSPTRTFVEDRSRIYEVAEEDIGALKAVMAAAAANTNSHL